MLIAVIFRRKELTDCHSGAAGKPIPNTNPKSVPQDRPEPPDLTKSTAATEQSDAETRREPVGHEHRGRRIVAKQWAKLPKLDVQRDSGAVEGAIGRILFDDGS